MKTTVSIEKQNGLEMSCIVSKCDGLKVCNTMIYHNNKYIIVFSLSYKHGSIPMICLVKRSRDIHDNIVREYQRVLGKMVLKDISSKYFLNPIASEYMNNGAKNLTAQEKEEICNLVMQNIPKNNLFPYSI